MSRKAIIIIFSYLMLLSCIAQVRSSFWNDDDADGKVFIREAVDKIGIDVTANTLCHVKKGTERQMIYTETVDKLVNYFKHMPSYHELIECRDQYLGILEKLNTVIKTGNEDVCDGEKISLIEDFHHDYISKNPRDTEQRLALNETMAPNLIKLFFMQYVTDVSTICARSAQVKLSVSKLDERLETNLREATRSLKDIVDLFDPRSGYNSMFMPWTLIDSLPMLRNELISKFLPIGEKRLFVQMHNVERFHEFQELCQNKLRPYYSQSLEPVLRLIDLGYYPDNEEFAYALKLNAHWISLYTLTVTCKTVLPIEAIENKELNEDETVLLTIDQAKQIMKIRNESLSVNELSVVKESQFELEDTDNSMVNFKSVEVTDNVNHVLEHVKSRTSGLNQIYSVLLRLFTNKVKTEIGKLFVLKGNNKENLEPLFDKSVANVDQSNPLKLREGKKGAKTKSEELLSENGNGASFVGIMKRFGWFLGSFGQEAGNAIVVAILKLFIAVSNMTFSLMEKILMF